MTPDQLLGAVVLVAGLALLLPMLVSLRRLFASSRARFPATADADGRLVDDHGRYHLLQPAGNPLVINTGDRLDVFPDPRVLNTVRLHRSTDVGLAAGLAAGGAVLTVAAAMVLATGRAPEEVDDAGAAVVLGIFGSICVYLAAIAVALAGFIITGLRGSRRVEGTVLTYEEIGGRKTTYRPLVEYHRDGTARRVWGVPLWSRPATGDPVTVRIAGRPPHEAVRTTPLALAGLVALAACGAFGLYFVALLLEVALF